MVKSTQSTVIAIDDKFGKWTVIDLAGRDASHHQLFLVQCECGATESMRGPELYTGRRYQCKTCAGQAKLELVGQRIGWLTVLEFAGYDINGGSLWSCLCDCGNTTIVRGNLLNSRSTKSCGCFNRSNESKSSRKEYGQAAFNRLYSRYKRGAKTRDLAFELDGDIFRSLTSSCCTYCGVSPTQAVSDSCSHKLYGDYFYNGIDRIDNSTGYTVENSCACCAGCNREKQGMSYDRWMKRVIGRRQRGVWPVQSPNLVINKE